MNDVTRPATTMKHTLAWGALLVVLATVIGIALFPDVAAIRARQEAAFANGKSLEGGAHAQSSMLLDLPVLFPLPDFHFTERSGGAVTRDGLRGMIWIADFIFVNCAGPCPIMTQHMTSLQKSLADLDKVRLVSFTVDPIRDTPEALRAYADQWHADADRWLFLTCDDQKLVHSLAIDGFKIVARTTTEAERDEGMDDILHSTNFALVDAAGRVRGFYDSLQPGALEKLIADTRRLYAVGGR